MHGETCYPMMTVLRSKTEIEEKLQELLNKAELCKETAIPAIFAVESKLPPFLEAADRSGDIDPMKKFVARAHSVCLLGEHLCFFPLTTCCSLQPQTMLTQHQKLTETGQRWHR